MAGHYLSLELSRGKYRWHFQYTDWQWVRQIKRRTKTWPEPDGAKAEQFVAGYWENFFRLLDAECFNCGEPNSYPLELCTTCSVMAGFWERAHRRNYDPYITQGWPPVRAEFIEQVVV